MTPERQALLDALLVERFTHLPQHPPKPARTPDDAARSLRLVIDNTHDRRRTA